MAKQLTLKENQTLYTLDIREDDLTDSIILKQAGREVAAIIPIEKYRIFEAWEKQVSEITTQYPELEANKAAFDQLEPALMADYRGKYVAFRNQKMVDSDEDKITLIKRIYKQLGYGVLYVQKVGEPLRTAKIISPRLTKS